MKDLKHSLKAVGNNLNNVMFGHVGHMICSEAQNIVQIWLVDNPKTGCKIKTELLEMEL